MLRCSIHVWALSPELQCAWRQLLNHLAPIMRATSTSLAVLSCGRPFLPLHHDHTVVRALVRRIRLLVLIAAFRLLEWIILVLYSTDLVDLRVEADVTFWLALARCAAFTACPACEVVDLISTRCLRGEVRRREIGVCTLKRRFATLASLRLHRGCRLLHQ